MLRTPHRLQLQSTLVPTRRQRAVSAAVDRTPTAQVQSGRPLQLLRTARWTRRLAEAMPQYAASQIGILREQTNRAGIWGIGVLIPAGLVLYSRRARSLFPQGSSQGGNCSGLGLWKRAKVFSDAG